MAQHGALLTGNAVHLYAGARVHYGWVEHEHHYADRPVMLTASEFAEALAASGAYPVKPLLEIAKASAHTGAPPKGS